MALIRRSDVDTLARDAIVLDLGRLEAQGDALVAAARGKAERIVADAEGERRRLVADASDVGRPEGIEAGRVEGLEAGREQGRAEALAAAGTEFESLISRWTVALDAFEAGRAALLGDAREDLLALACEIARRVTGRTIEIDPGVIVDQFAEVLDIVVQPTTLRVRIHPDDEPLIAEALPRLRARFSEGSHIELVADGELPPGSCVALTERHGVVDGSITTKLDRLIDSILPRGGEER